MNMHDLSSHLYSGNLGYKKLEWKWNPAKSSWIAVRSRFCRMHMGFGSICPWHWIFTAVKILNLGYSKTIYWGTFLLSFNYIVKFMYCNNPFVRAWDKFASRPGLVSSQVSGRTHCMLLICAVCQYSHTDCECVRVLAVQRYGRMTEHEFGIKIFLIAYPSSSPNVTSKFAERIQ